MSHTDLKTPLAIISRGATSDTTILRTVRSTRMGYTDSGQHVQLNPPRPRYPRRQSRHQRFTETTLTCPSCGREPVGSNEWHQQRLDLAILWLYPDPHHPDQVLERRHCVACQPHADVSSIGCLRCGDGPLLAGSLSEPASRAAGQLEPTCRWLITRRWRQTATGWLCDRHRDCR